MVLIKKTEPYNYLEIDEIKHENLVKEYTKGVSFLAHSYNDPTKPREEIFITPQTVWVVYSGKIKPAVLMRVPKRIQNYPLIGVVGFFVGESQQRMVQMWQVGFTKKEACEILERIKYYLK